MIELRTLGGAAVTLRGGESAPAASTQPKRLALLVYLAMAEPPGLRRRDVVVAHLWPELDAAHARAALRQALHAIRRAIGDDVIVTRGEEEIGVNQAVIQCDAAAFDICCRKGRSADALDLYRGDFLQGFFPTDVAPEFEQWMDETRAALRRQAGQCAAALSDAFLKAGGFDAAVAYARRAAELMPEDERAVANLIAVLDVAGDRVGALDAYETLAARLKAEYDATPSPETQALVARVRARTAVLSPIHELPETASAPAGPARELPRRKRVRPAVVIVTALAIAGIVAAAEGGKFIGPPATVGVFPFENANGDTLPRYLADGITDQLNIDLGQHHKLRVINRPTMQAYAHSGRSTADVARELHADALVYGTLHAWDDSIRVGLRVVQLRGTRETWQASFDGLRADVFRIQVDASRALVQRIAGLPSLPHEPLPVNGKSVDPQALEAYIKGRYYWNERRIPSLLRAIDLFREALHADPTFALAYSAMGDAYVQLGYTNGLAPGDAFPKARSAATRALSLDATLAEPHATLGFVDLYYDWDWPGADRELRQAIAMNPSYATAHEWYGYVLTAMGRFDEARAEERRAQELDPLSIAIAASAGFMKYYAGDLKDAQQDLRIALRADSAFPLGHFYLGRMYEQAGQTDSALAQYAATGALRAWPPTLIAEGHVFASLGRRSEAMTILARLDSMSHTQYVTSYGPALLYAELRQPDSAFAWLDRAYNERTNWMVWLNRDPRWAAIRRDPRFAKLTERLRLPN